jgi:predicted O-linked N-acetylglucosamine transferase (SPINDLY family)
LALNELKLHDAAIESYDKAIAIRANTMEAHFNRGLALHALKRRQSAIESYNRAIALRPDLADAYYNRGLALDELKQYEAAIESFDKAYAIKPDFEFLYGKRLNAQMAVCSWNTVEAQISHLVMKIRQNQKVTSPFAIIALSDSLPLQRQVAEAFVKHHHPVNFEFGSIPKRPRGQKIRLGYFSADFHNHATAYLMADLFEKHDRDKFELVAFSFGTVSNDEMQQRIRAAFDRFEEVRNQTVKEIAQLARGIGIDIAIDLKGFTQDARVGIFCYRVAPVQVNYLGYPGTMGADYMDYLIADKILIPEVSQVHYSEKIIYLPNSYQVNAKRKISDKLFTRAELGLPESGFVFCCFNNNYKITPRGFDGWMRILSRVDGSVLWLLEDSPTAASNLRKEAQLRGVSPERLVFAQRMPLPEHLARHRAADLFIDTLPCNAHTTASDALWAGLPVLTCTGEAFASRVAASLLNAIGLPELITTTQEDYEALAVELATNTQRFKSIKQKLERNRLTTPLFDTKLFTQHIEEAYAQMIERYHANLAPQHIFIGQ